VQEKARVAAVDAESQSLLVRINLRLKLAEGRMEQITNDPARERGKMKERTRRFQLHISSPHPPRDNY